MPEFRHYQGERPPKFGNPVEVEFAKILDYYGLAWQHEPREFFLRARDPEGALVDVGPSDLVDGVGLPRGWECLESFRPDFYLPEQDLYIETTVMKQSLTTKKNRKARLTRERYGIKLKVFYRRDFEVLAQSFGFPLPEPGPSEPAVEPVTEPMAVPALAVLLDAPPEMPLALPLDERVGGYDSPSL